MQKRIQIRRILLLLLAVLNLSCDSGESLSEENPSNLVIEITQPEEEPGKILIEARADNAIAYTLYIGTASEPETENTSGLFEYMFLQSGYYQIEVRAFGTSGMYIKESRQVVVDMNNGVSIDDGYLSPLTYEGYNLVWNDEFNSTEVDPANWVFETGTGCPNICGWGNNELQFYRPENAWVEDGVLTIEARNENFSGSSYTSARMKTQNKRSFKYGRIDIRALLPKGQGIWPALWMLGDNITSVGWPGCGEIDIMEMVGGDGRDNQVHGTLHYDDNGHVYTGGKYTLSAGYFYDEFHVFTILWDQNSIQWLVNDVQFHEIDITPAHMAEFHEKFFLIFNVAVGGNWPGSPDATTVFPQQMKVDYIRVFQAN